MSNLGVTRKKYEDFFCTIPHRAAFYGMLLLRTFSYPFLLHIRSMSDSESDMERIWSREISDKGGSDGLLMELTCQGRGE